MIQERSILSRSVLVLNRLWQPVHICNVRRAFALLYKNAAHVVAAQNGSFETYPFSQWVAAGVNGGDTPSVGTVSMRIRMPEIILLIHYDRLPLREVKLTRRNVYLRDKNTCQYCGRTLRDGELNLDHVVPRHLGGGTTWTNIVCSCVTCNLKKGEKTPDHARMGLLKKPVKPRWSPFNRIAFRGEAYASWEHFLSPAGWKVQISNVLS
ncbi:MAG: HNH endonuclease [Candidatus Aureabacteria bacterium]|nr:HNH endonuclease [Candidatus Auribacterota bacterium]